MEAKHTPGPWEVFQLGTGRKIVRQARPIPAVIIIPDLPQWMGEKREEMDANARLIAAAPDLLRVLGVLREKWEGDSWVTDQQEMLELTRAVIAKATGEPS